MSTIVRRAEPHEAETLTALAIRSKRHWAYDEAFMQRAEPHLRITESDLAHASAFVAERDQVIVGVYVLQLENGVPNLSDFWVDPAAIGTGVGSRLWRHMLAMARELGYAKVQIAADPNAAGFYLRMGARRAGETPSAAIAGRMLPAFEIEP